MSFAEYKRSAKNGMRVSAVTQLSSKEISSTQNKLPANSPVASDDKPIGAKAIMPITVAPSSGHWFCLTTLTAASTLLMPRRIPTIIPSAMTIALSTSMPSAIINAPRETRCRLISPRRIKMKVPSTVNNSTVPISKPLRKPMVSSNAIITMATASTRFSRKSLTEFST